MYMIDLNPTLAVVASDSQLAVRLVLADSPLVALELS